ncbi:hypothetical protein MML48_6g00014287 [Holotrichia oblita]|uniref:Uncharacterized protein n=1 Tax=Holotrichia oblita TaxID=644536 RepID=A0ACB9SYN5_HOLOL|nr:hypothetical protein MML48_6g00014287 [Holotrichia oblita]
MFAIKYFSVLNPGAFRIKEAQHRCECSIIGKKIFIPEIQYNVYVVRREYRINKDREKVSSERPNYTIKISLQVKYNDVTIIAKSQKELIKAINRLEKEAGKYGLEINEKKTKYMKIRNEIEENMNHLRTQSYKFEKVTMLNYLGVSLGQTYKHRIKERIQKGYQALGRNKMLLKSKNISKANKIQIYKSLIRPVITYALETVVLNKREEEDLKIIERKILRIILGPDTTKERVKRTKKNKEIEQELEKTYKGNKTEMGWTHNEERTNANGENTMGSTLA